MEALLEAISIRVGQILTKCRHLSLLHLRLVKESFDCYPSESSLGLCCEM